MPGSTLLASDEVVPVAIPVHQGQKLLGLRVVQFEVPLRPEALQVGEEQEPLRQEKVHLGLRLVQLQLLAMLVPSNVLLHPRMFLPT